MFSKSVPHPDNYAADDGLKGNGSNLQTFGRANCFVMVVGENPEWEN